MKRPWFPFYAADWLCDVDVVVMSLEERGAYITLLAYQWREGSIPGNPRQIGRILGLVAHEESGLLEAVLCKFVQSPRDPKRLVNPRLERVREEQEALSIANSINGQERAKQASRDGNGRYKRSSDPTSASPAGEPATHQPSKSKTDTKTDTDTKDRKDLAADKPQPLPFKPDEAVLALATASCGRFTASKLLKGQAINATRLIREFPNIDTWKLVGQWLQAGGESWRQHIDVRALSDMTVWVSHAKAWEAQGRPPVHSNGTANKARGHSAPSEGPPESQNQSGLLR